MRITKISTTLAALALVLSTSMAALAADITLLNVSYDPTRELYSDFNKVLAEKER